MKHHHITLKERARGFHLVTDEILADIPSLPHTGMLHLFIKHTSAGLTINENADPDVRSDFELFFDRLAPENFPGISHTMEGPDDMPAHIKASLVGFSVTIPIVAHQPDLGTWQGIYLCEFRNHGGPRRITVSVSGD